MKIKKRVLLYIAQDNETARIIQTRAQLRSSSFMFCSVIRKWELYRVMHSLSKMKM